MRDWAARFALACEKCQGLNVMLAGGVAPTAPRFAQYLHRAHRVCP